MKVKKKASSRPSFMDANQMIEIKAERREGSHSPEAGGTSIRGGKDEEGAMMTPVETATLLLLSRLALFNKVRLLTHWSPGCKK